MPTNVMPSFLNAVLAYVHGDGLVILHEMELLLTQTNIKRLMAYSSISHVGYILLGLVAGNSTGLTGMVFYLIA